MANQPQQPRRTAPLIQRPQSNLSSAIAGALSGMGMQPARPAWGVPPPPPWATQTQGQPQAGYPAPQYPRGGAFDPNLPFSPQQASSFQPPFFQQQQQYQQPFPFPYQQQPQQQPYPSGPPLRTTAEGYTLSSSYIPPPPSAAPPPSAPRPNLCAGGLKLRAGGRASSSNGGGGGGQQVAPLVSCQKDGCSFEGTRKLVREHEEDRHLIFAEGREPKPYVATYKASEGARIEGSSISLDSPEAIAQWIAERKARWPSKQVVKVKEQQRSDRIAAGLEAPPRTRGGRGGRGDRGSRGRGRGRGGRNGDEGREWGGVKSKMVMSSSSSFSDSDDSSDDGPPVPSSSKVAVPSLDEVKNSASKVEAGVLEGGGARVHPDRAKRGAPAEEVDEKNEEKEFQVVCRHWRRGNCAQGPACPYLHSLPAASSHPPPPPKRRRPAPPAPAYNPFARADPFAQLAERDVAQVTSDVLQVVDFLVRNAWLRGVEGRVGECDEEGGIEELGGECVEGRKENAERVKIEDVDGEETRVRIEGVDEEGGDEDMDEEGMDDGVEGDEDDIKEEDEELSTGMDVVPVEDDDEDEASAPATRWDDLVPVDDSDDFDEEDHLALFLADSS